MLPAPSTRQHEEQKRGGQHLEYTLKIYQAVKRHNEGTKYMAEVEIIRGLSRGGVAKRYGITAGTISHREKNGHPLPEPDIIIGDGKARSSVGWSPAKYPELDLWNQGVQKSGPKPKK